ncbi:MAG TPA: hypothetical protein VKM93_09790 [Terriglobia bacterium]|nr:hypothetical protein [Terriglobia bacterium]
MNDASINLSASQPSALRRRQALAVAIGFVAVVWFLLLSGWIGATPGNVMMRRPNVLFGSDTSLWLGRMIGNERSPERIIHPLEVPLWRPPCRALFHLLTIFLPSDYAMVWAGRLLVAIIAGAGVGFMAFAALHNGLKLTQCILLFIMYLLFTTNSTVSIPEHFGISNGLLSIAFVVPFIVASARIRTTVLAALVVLCGGTTITNVLFPIGSLVHFYFKSMRLKVGLLLAAIPAALGAAYFLYKRSSSIHWFFSQYSNLRLLRHPLSAGVYAIYALVCPAVGPTPRILRFPGWDMVSYEPDREALRLSYYFGVPRDYFHLNFAPGLTWLPAIGAAAWLALLLISVYQGLKGERTRSYVWLLLGWILFNIVFHNIWGDEFMLYAPHWSWALMGLVILGARDFSRRFIATMFVPIVISQIYTLLAIRSAVLAITQ